MSYAALENSGISAVEAIVESDGKERFQGEP